MSNSTRQLTPFERGVLEGESHVFLPAYSKLKIVSPTIEDGEDLVLLINPGKRLWGSLKRSTKAESFREALAQLHS
jgi:hypothetical protein